MTSETLQIPITLGISSEEAPQPVQHVDPQILFGRPTQAGERILLGALGDLRFRILEPLAVRFFEVEGQHVAEALDLNEFGHGPSRFESLVDLQRALAALYLGLEARQSTLGRELAAVWTRLRRHVEYIGRPHP